MTTSCSSGKRRFRDRIAAEAALARITFRHEVSGRRRAHAYKVPVRTYRCPECHGWHLTSRANGREAQ